MQRRTVGPTLMLDGLQLMPAQGKTGGLYRSLNVINRDDYLQVRHGQALRAMIVSGDAANNDVTFVTAAAFTGQNKFFIGFTSVPVPDTYLVFTQGAGQGGIGDLCEDGVTIEFWGTDNAWHSLDILSTTGDKSFYITLGIEVFLLLVPFGWQLAQPVGTASVKFWLRFTRNVGVFADQCVFGKYLNQVNTKPLSSAVEDRLVMAPRTRTDRGPYVIQRTIEQNASFPIAWDIFDLSLAPIIHNTYLNNGATANSDGLLKPLYATLAVAGQAEVASESDTAAAVYVPAADRIIASLGKRYVAVDCATAAASEFAPDPQSDPELDPYADIGVELAIPASARVMVVFGERIFFLGFPDDPTKLVWTAPGPFYNVLPSANVAHVNGGGQFQGAVAIDQSLFILTENGIWRAALGDPTDGNESNLFITQVEETPCASRRSVVAVGKSIVFLSSDGVRQFDGIRSRLISQGVVDLFRPNSEHPLACLRPQYAVGCWNPIENQYRLSYPSPAGQHHDTMLVVDLDDRTAWLWGADPMSSVESGVENPAQGVIGQRRNGIRAVAMCWDYRRQAVLESCPEGLVGYQDDGEADFGQPIAWYAESQTLRIAASERGVVEQVLVQVARDHFQPMNVDVIPDGDYARKDTRAPTVQQDLLDTTAALDAVSLAGNMVPLQLDGSLAPLQARFRKAGRNHRIRLSGVPPSYTPFRVMSLQVDIAVDEKRR